MLFIKMNEIIDEVNSEVAEREELIECIALCLLAGKNLFILGDTGQAKSYAINEFRKRITGAKQYERLMSKQTDEEQLFGRLDLSSLIPGNMPQDELMKDKEYEKTHTELERLYKEYEDDGQNSTLGKAIEEAKKLASLKHIICALKSGSPKMITDGKIPDCHIVFLDEIFKSNDGILNSLLTALNEKVYTNEGNTVKIPTISFFTASNEIPNFNDSTQARRLRNMAFEYEHFDIIEVAKYCGIQFHHHNSNDVEFKALCPFCNDRKYHLGINRQKERFNCFKCGESGNAVSLYAKMCGVSNKEACEALKGNIEIFKPAAVQYREVPEMPIRSIEDRHNVYYDFLSLLKLNKAHRQALEMRGLSFKHIHQFMYRSMPMDRVFRREVLEKLASKHDLIGIPGFYIDDYGDLQMYINKHGGIFIPVCNHEGYIQGLQMRLDVPADSDEKKFRWFSSKHYPSGTGAKPWIHIVGDTNAKEACLTEGAMKADVTSVLSNGQLFIAVPGVNAITYLPEIINELGITRIYEAMDMDKRSKPEVKKAMIALRTALNGTGVENISCTWNPAYKGLDDYFLAKVLEKQSQAMPVAA